MPLYIENYNPEVKQAKGIYTRYAVYSSVGSVSLAQNLPSAATITVPTTGGTILNHTPTQNETINGPATVIAGQTIRFLITTSGVTSYTLTFGTNFRTQGTLATGTVSGKIFVIEFLGDAVNNSYDEIARTTAM